MASAREVLAAIARAMEGLGGAAPADAAITRQLGTPTQYPSAMDARRALQPQDPFGPGGRGPGVPMAHGQPPSGNIYPPTPRGPDIRGTFGRGTQAQPYARPEGGTNATNRGLAAQGAGYRYPPGLPNARSINPMAHDLLRGTPSTSLIAPNTPRGPVGPNIRGTFGRGTQPPAPARPPMRPNMRMGFPPGATPPAIRGLGPRTAGASLTAPRGSPGPFAIPPGGTQGSLNTVKPATRGQAAAARSMAGQAAGGEVRAATAAMSQPITPSSTPRGWQGITRPYAYPEGFEPPGGGRTPPPPRGAAPYGQGPQPHPGYRGGSQNLPAVWQQPSFGKTSYGGMAGWAKGAHNPIEIARNYSGQLKATAAGTAGAHAANLGRIGTNIASRGWGPSTMAFFRAANPAIMTAMAGNLLLGAAGFEEGTKGDIVGEGLMVGAAFGAPWGGVGALVGAPAFMALNVITGGAAANLVQKLPLIGSVFGGTEVTEEDARDIAKTMFGNAATAQGLDPAAAEAMSSTFEAYWKMAEADLIDPTQLVPMMYQVGRMHGLTGFPWEPETMNPAYSPEDIAGITESVGKALAPLQDVATGIGNMDYSHIQDETIRARLEESSARVAGNILSGMSAAVQGPATTAIMGEATANAQLGGQLGGIDPFEANLLGAMG